MDKKSYRLPPITLLAVLVEFTILSFVSVNATSDFLSADPAIRIPGREFEWLTSSTWFASLSLHQNGYLPLWQPYLNHGEPLIDNPFSMVLNPINTIPTLIYGNTLGLRYSVVLSALGAALGGWALGRMLGFGSLGRILLGMLLAGKGNMLAMIGQGYFQLGVSQAYMPWIIAGTVGVLRMKHRRFPVVLTAIAITLMFWAGNIYHVLPMVVSVVALGITHLFIIRRSGNRVNRIEIDMVALKRLVGTGLLTIGLSAVTLLPIFLHQHNIGGHPNEHGAGTVVDLASTVRLFFDGNLDNFTNGIAPGPPEHYASYILPLWFGVLMFALLPPIGRWLYRSPLPRGWQVWGVGLFVIVFFTLWGTGHNPIVGWLYANLPLIGQWRYVGRMLGVVSFWIAVLAVLRVDGLWRALALERTWQTLPVLRRIPALGSVLALGLIAASFYAASDVLAQWKAYAGIRQLPIDYEVRSIQWLRQRYPDRFLSVWTMGYGTVDVYMEYRVRHAAITADYFAIGNPPTLFSGNLTNTMPEFGIPWSDSERAYLQDNGYVPLEDSPAPYGVPSVLRKADVLPYAFTATRADLTAAVNTLPLSVVTPVERYRELPDHIFLAVSTEAGKPRVVTVQEVAYPGWTVQVDGKPTNLESVGGLIGVVLPDGTGQHLVEFAYRPPLLLGGAMLTLLAALLSGLYLLRLDGLIPVAWKRQATVAVNHSAKGLYTVLTSPDLFAPKMSDEDVPLLLPGQETNPEAEEIEPAEAEMEAIR